MPTSTNSRQRRRRDIPRYGAVAHGLLACCVTACTSAFELELPDQHPARPHAGTAGPLQAPSPFRIPDLRADAPPDAGVHGTTVHGTNEHGAHAPEPEPQPPPGRGSVIR